jgi:hypothetical protein
MTGLRAGHLGQHVRREMTGLVAVRWPVMTEPPKRVSVIKRARWH